MAITLHGVTVKDRNTVESDGFVLGVTQPTAANTGLTVDPASLTVVSSAFTAAAGVTYTGMDFQNWVTVNVAGAQFVNCRFRGAPVGDETKWLADCSGASCVGATFTHCLFEPTDHTQMYGGGLGGHDWTATRCRFTGCIDSTDPFNLHAGTANVTVLGCLLEACDAFYPDPQHDDGSHCDNCQPTNGSNITIRGNTMTGMLSATSTADPYYPQGNSAIQLNQNNGPLSNVTIDSNWLDGGSIAAVNVSEGTYGAISGLAITNNRFGRSGRVAAQGAGMDHAMQNWAINVPAATRAVATITGNVYADDGTAVTIHGS